MIYVLTGENSFELRRELRRAVDEFVAEHGDLALVRLDGEESTYDQMREAIESVPFLASRKLIVLTTPSAQKEFVERAQDLLSAADDTTDVVIVEPKLDKRSTYYKYLKKLPEFHEFNQVEAGQLASWLVSEAQRARGKLTQADARYLVDRVGTNQLLLGNELTKLLTYSPEVSRQTIEALTERSPQSTIFDLLDAMMSGRQREAMQLYEEQRQLRVEPQQIVAMLAWQLHAMSVVVTAGSRSDDEIAREARLSPYVVKKTRGLVRGMRVADIRDMVQRALALDVGSKTGKIDIDQGLRNFIVGVG